MMSSWMAQWCLPASLVFNATDVCNV